MTTRSSPEVIRICLDPRHAEPCFSAGVCDACAADDCSVDEQVVIRGRFTLDDEPIADFRADYLEVNREGFEADDYRRIADLTVGATLIFGGGAAAEFVLRRVA